MKTRLLIIPLTAFLMFSGLTTDIHALSCALPLLGMAYDNSDYVIHGKVIAKNYLTWSLQKPMVTFDVLESFKGNVYDQISVSVNENWDYEFEDGFEYVVFIQRTELSLEIDSCSPKFLAFPSVVEIIRQVSLPDSEMRFSTSDMFYNSLTDQEKLEFESTNILIQEKKLERWDSVTSQRQLIIVSSLLLIPISSVSAFVIFRRKRQ